MSAKVVAKLPAVEIAAESETEVGTEIETAAGAETEKVLAFVPVPVTAKAAAAAKRPKSPPWAAALSMGPAPASVAASLRGPLLGPVLRAAMIDERAAVIAGARASALESRALQIHLLIPRSRSSRQIGRAHV